MSITLMHIILKFLVAWLLRSILAWSRGVPGKELGWSKYVQLVAVSGASSALDIGFSNWSFEFITVSLYTMTKSTSVIFIVMFSVLLNDYLNMSYGKLIKFKSFWLANVL
ncbi:unnamed protein product [Trichobilharzia regenti]|nr:unnamed protein product [Trichobilharzia regenti]